MVCTANTSKVLDNFEFDNITCVITQGTVCRPNGVITDFASNIHEYAKLLENVKLEWRAPREGREGREGGCAPLMNNFHRLFILIYKYLKCLKANT